MNAIDESLQRRFEEAIRRLIFVGFNSRVAAVDRDTGEVVWQWKAPKGTSTYVALLLDGDRLIASVQGYTYCLNPLNGEQIWVNPLKGFGIGVPCLASVRGTSSSAASAAGEVLDQARRSAEGAG